MPLITLDDITLSFSDKPILDGISSTINKGDKIALIGRNGQGKSTLLRLLAGKIEADDGKLKVKNNTVISYLEQTLPKDSDKTLFEIVASGLGETGDLISQYQKCLVQQQLEQSTSPSSSRSPVAIPLASRNSNSLAEILQLISPLPTICPRFCALNAVASSLK